MKDAIALFTILAALVTMTASAQDYAIYVSNERSGNLTVIDARTNQAMATFPVGKRPRGIHCAPDGRTLYVALSGSPRMGPGADRDRAAAPPADKAADGIGVVDATSLKMVKKIEAGSDPEQFAISADGTRLFVANEDVGKVSILELPSGSKLAEVPVSEEPEGVGFERTSGRVYVTCEEQGELHVIDPANRRSIARVKVGGRPRSVAFSPDGARAFVPSEAEALVSVLDTIRHEVVRSIPTGAGTLPMGAVISRNGKELYVTTGRGNSVVVIDTEANAVTHTIPVGTRAWGAALSPDGTRLYTANGGSNDVSVIDLQTKKELARVKVGDGPWGLAIGPRMASAGGKPTP